MQHFQDYSDRKILPDSAVILPAQDFDAQYGVSHVLQT